MTIVCRSRKFIFVHLTKCGGTSVEQSFAPHARWNDLIVGSTAWGELLQPVYGKLLGLTKHSTAQQIEKSVGADVWSEYWTVALVRHPLRVYESFYGWIADVIDEYLQRNQLDRDHFIERYRNDDVSARFTHWWITKPFLESTSFAEFMDMVLEQRLGPAPMTARLSRAKSLMVDDVFKLEEIDRFWQALETNTGLTVQRLHTNRSKKRDYQWDARHIAKISQALRRRLPQFRL